MERQRYGGSHHLRHRCIQSIASCPRRRLSPPLAAIAPMPPPDPLVSPRPLPTLPLQPLASPVTVYRLSPPCLRPQPHRPHLLHLLRAACSAARPTSWKFFDSETNSEQQGQDIAQMLRQLDEGSREQVEIRTHTHARTRTRTHARTHAHARTQARTSTLARARRGAQTHCDTHIPLPQCRLL